MSKLQRSTATAPLRLIHPSVFRLLKCAVQLSSFGARSKPFPCCAAWPSTSIRAEHEKGKAPNISRAPDTRGMEHFCTRVAYFFVARARLLPFVKALVMACEGHKRNPQGLLRSMHERGKDPQYHPHPRYEEGEALPRSSCLFLSCSCSFLAICQSSWVGL